MEISKLDELTFIRDGHACGSIVVSDGSSPDVHETALDLSNILARMSGANLSVVSEIEEYPALILGVRGRDNSLQPLAYHVWREDDAIYFSGGSDQGVINGVYAFLEKELGCRWYIPGPLGDYLPTRETIRLDEVNLQGTPDFQSITGFGTHPNAEIGRIWTRRNRLDGFPQHFHSHNSARIATPDMLDEHPEYFALCGKRRNQKQMCTTQPAVVEWTISAARTYLDENPGMESFSLSPGDFRGFCQCEGCRGLDDELGIDPFILDGSLSDRLVVFFNKVAEEVVKTHPDKRLAFYAYMNYTRAPEVVKPHPMLLPVLVHTPWDYCMHHPIDDPDCERNRRFADAVKGWHKLCQELYLYDYWAHYHLCGHHGIVHNIRRDLPWLRQNGVVGFYGEMHPQRWTQPLNYYLPARLAWNVDTDVDVIVTEFYDHMFGPAATVVSEYAQLFEDVMAGVPKDAEHDGELAFVRDMAPELFDHARELLDTADGIITGADIDPVEKHHYEDRLRRFRIGLRVTEQMAREKRSRFDGRVIDMMDHLESFMGTLDELEADPDLQDIVAIPLSRQMARVALMRLEPYRGIWERAIPEPERRKEIRKLLDKDTHEVARALGYWTDWHIVGQWMNPEGNLLDVPYPPEEGVDLNATYEVRVGTRGWKFHQSKHPYGIVDLVKFFAPEDSEFTVAYAYTTLESRRNADARLDIMCDDDIVIWLNDEIVFAGGAITGNFDIHVDAKLIQGRNVFLVKAFNKPHAFEFSIRIADENGQPHDAVVWE
jgi:hypothetical protein